MALKTLEDSHENQEAIKWVKDIDNKIRRSRGWLEETEKRAMNKKSQIILNKINELLGERKVLMKFHNITEEDLI